MSIGEIVNELIMTNIRIWHEDTKLRQGQDLSDKEQAKLCAEGRLLNAKRSELKAEVNAYFGESLFDDRKLNYTRSK